MPSPPEFVVAVPARYAASRLPGKPLRLLAGEPLVLHVARRALEAGAREVWLATDDARIAAAVAGIDGVRVAMTSAGRGPVNGPRAPAKIAPTRGRKRMA